MACGFSRDFLRLAPIHSGQLATSHEFPHRLFIRVCSVAGRIRGRGGSLSNPIAQNAFYVNSSSPRKDPYTRYIPTSERGTTRSSTPGRNR